MDSETVQAAKSMARDFGNRVRLDFLNDQKANQAMARRVKGPVSAYRVGRAALMNAVAAEGTEERSWAMNCGPPTWSRAPMRLSSRRRTTGSDGWPS